MHLKNNPFDMKTKRILKKAGIWAGLFLVGLTLILILTYVYIFWQTEKSEHAVYTSQTIDIEIPEDSASIARGGHLFTVHACADCHPGSAGKTILEEPMIGRFTAPTSPVARRTSPDFNEQDWLRALKLGINKEGRSLKGMPSTETTKLPDKDLADLIAYCRSRPPVDNVVEDISIGPLIRVLTAMGKVDLFTAEHIDQKITYKEQPALAITAEFGATLAVSCSGCHRENLQGGPSQIPGQPPVPNISSTGRVANWSEEQFMQTLRTGVTPKATNWITHSCLGRFGISQM
jgi:mono/diheme cytochrome c family protein